MESAVLPSHHIMDYPDSANSSAKASSPIVVQESPFCTYVSSLSPIKLVDNMRVPLAFPELNFSSPSPVFTSPRINQMRKENSLRRLQYLSSDSGKLSLEYTAGTKELPENGSHHGPDASHSRGVLIPKHEIPAQVQSCSSPSGCVDDFFVDPMEHCVNSLAPSELRLDEAVESCQPSRDRCGSPGKTPSKECIQLQRYHLSCSVNELVANKAENGKTANSIEMFPDHCRSQAVEIHDSGTKEIITTVHSHQGNIKEGGIKVAEPSTPACQAEESPIAYEWPTHLICGQTKDYVDVADNIHKNGERQFNQCTGLPSRRAMKDDPAEVLASVNLESCRHSEDLTANGTISIQPCGAKGDSLDHVAETHLAEDGRGAEQDATSQFQLELLHIAHPDIHHQDNSRAGCNTSIQHAISCKQGHLPSKLQLIVEGEHRKTKNERCENNPCDGTDAVEDRSEMSTCDKCLPLSPLTRLLQSSNGINMFKSQFSARRYLSSPESAACALSPFSPCYSRNNDMLQAIEGNLDLASYHKEVYVHDEVELGTYSPGREWFVDICNLGRLSNSSGNPREQTKLSFQVGYHPSLRSLLWHTSPNTPTPWFSEGKLALDSCSQCGTTCL